MSKRERFKEHKRNIRAFLRDWPEERLAMLLAHAQSGKLSFNSCCCFIGVRTANHFLQSAHDKVAPGDALHLLEARNLPGARMAEFGFHELGPSWLSWNEQDARRRRILIPMIRAEFKRRERAGRKNLHSSALVSAILDKEERCNSAK